MTTMPEPHLEASEEPSVVLVCRFCAKDAHREGRRPRKIENMAQENLALLTDWSKSRNLYTGDDVAHYCSVCSLQLSTLRKASGQAAAKPKSGAEPRCESVEFSVAP